MQGLGVTQDISNSTHSIGQGRSPIQKSISIQGAEQVDYIQDDIPLNGEQGEGPTVDGQVQDDHVQEEGGVGEMIGEGLGKEMLQGLGVDLDALEALLDDNDNGGDSDGDGEYEVFGGDSSDGDEG